MSGHLGANGSVPTSGRTGGGVLVEHVTKTYRQRSGPDGERRLATALDDVSLTVPEGHFVSVIGPSGSGKSTLLRIVAGLLPATSGTVTVFGETPGDAVAHKRIGFVPQSPALLPWRSVLDNVRLPSQVNRRADNGRPAPDPVAILEAVGLGDALHQRPASLSGGMRQRVAIARAFAVDPSLLVMDEPFSALDELTRETLRDELLALWEADRKTVLFVTHSVTEAVLLSDSVAVLSPSPGRLVGFVPVTLPRPRGEESAHASAFFEAERTVRAALRAGSPR